MGVENTPIEQFFADKAASSSNVVREANAPRTVQTGSYTLQASKAEGKTWSNETNVREGVHFQLSVLKGERKVGTVFADMSWQEARYKNGNLDTKSKLWLQLIKATNPDLKPDEQANLTVQQVVDAATKYPFSGYVMEQYMVPATEDDKANGYYMEFKRKSAKTEDEAAEYRKAGYKVVNTLSNVYPHKPESNG